MRNLALAVGLVVLSGCSLLEKVGVTPKDVELSCHTIAAVCAAPKDENTAAACAILSALCVPPTTTTTTLPTI